MIIMLTGCPSPGGGETGTDPAKPTGGGATPGNPDSPGRTLSFTLELSEPSGSPLELGSGPSRTTVTSDAGTPAIGTVSGKTYPLTVTQVPPTAAELTLTVKKTGFLDITIGPISIPPAGNPPPPQTKTIPYAYTTTITGTVTTPAGNPVTQYDSAARRSSPSGDDAEVWASTDPAVKAAVAADGSFTLRVRHPGTFALTADYPAGRDYKTGAPQTVSTTESAHTQDIPLRYGYTTTLSGRVFDRPPGSSVVARNDAAVIVEVEGREAGRTVSSTIDGSPGSYRITFDHPGTFRVTTSFESRSNTLLFPQITAAATTHGPTID